MLREVPGHRPRTCVDAAQWVPALTEHCSPSNAPQGGPAPARSEGVGSAAARCRSSRCGVRPRCSSAARGLPAMPGTRGPPPSLLLALLLLLLQGRPTAAAATRPQPERAALPGGAPAAAASGNGTGPVVASRLP